MNSSRIARALAAIAVAALVGIGGGMAASNRPTGRDVIVGGHTPAGTPVATRPPVVVGSLRVAATHGLPSRISDSELNARNAALFAELRGQSGGGQRVADYTRPAPGTTLGNDTVALGGMAHAPCSDRAPSISEVKGVITPNGGVGVMGSCFGTAPGEIRVYGAFPGGYLVLQSPIWSDTAAGGTLPYIDGVIEQPVRIELVRSDQRASARRDGFFVPKWQEDVIVPSSLIRNDVCDQPAPDCARGGATQGVHIVKSQDGAVDFSQATQDTWDVRLAKGWHLTTMDIWNDFATPPAGVTVTGFDQGPPEQATFTFHMTATCSSYETNRPIQADLCVQLMAKYSFRIHAFGPVGVLPTPAQ